jgi:hypothetical protein
MVHVAETMAETLVLALVETMVLVVETTPGTMVLVAETMVETMTGLHLNAPLNADRAAALHGVTPPPTSFRPHLPRGSSD